MNDRFAKELSHEITNIQIYDMLEKAKVNVKDWTKASKVNKGYLFLTTSLKEAKAYGQYVIPCELKNYNSKTFNVNANNPSQIFDKDYGIDLYKNDKYFGFWEKFEESGKSVLVIKGTDRSTIITYVENVIPRIDLATQFYGAV